MAQTGEEGDAGFEYLFDMIHGDKKHWIEYSHTMDRDNWSIEVIDENEACRNGNPYRLLSRFER